MRHINYLMLPIKGILVAGAICCLLQQATHAMTTVSLTALPAIIDTGGEAGSEITFSFQLTNNNGAVLPIHMSLRDSQVREGQTEELVRSLSAKDWVSYTEPDFIIEAYQTKEVSGIVKIPKDAGAGGHYVDLVAQSLRLEGKEGIIATQSEIGVQVLIGVAGDIKEDLSVSSIGPSTIIIDPSAPKSLTFSVKNNGNTHTQFNSNVYMESKRNDIFAKDYQPEMIFPGESKQISFNLPASLKPGIYTAKINFTFGTSPKKIGAPPVTVFVLPFDPKLLFIFPLLVVAVYAYHVRRRLVLAVKIVAKGEDNSIK